MVSVEKASVGNGSKLDTDREVVEHSGKGAETRAA